MLCVAKGDRIKASVFAVVTELAFSIGGSDSSVVLPDPPKKAKPVLKTTSKGSLPQKAIPPVVLQTTPKVRAAAALQTTPEVFSLFPIVVRDTGPIDWHYLDANRVELYSAQGQRIRPASRIDLGGTAVSLDFHQVLDTFREGSYADISDCGRERCSG